MTTKQPIPLPASTPSTAKDKTFTFDPDKWKICVKGLKADDIQRDFLYNLEYNIAKDKFTLTPHDQFMSLSYTVRQRLIERWIMTQQQYHTANTKRVYYLSLEFLMGRLLGNNMINLGLLDQCSEALADLGLDVEDVRDQERDAGLGNGGLGRLAACFLDSMATMQLPAIGYGIRYDFGIFNQKIVNGNQIEHIDEWLEFGNPWEIERPEYKYKVQFFGKTNRYTDAQGKQIVQWIDTEDVMALPYDVPIPGFGTNTVNTLRLWSARAANEFNLDVFNSGDYIGACQTKMLSENISRILYPNDNNYSGRELRLKQQHFFTSASLHDIVRRFLHDNKDFAMFPDKVAIQLNDTHPSISIAELMRILLDEHGLAWEQAWDITRRTFAYTNHTLMPEALERWPLSLMQKLLPRHVEIIFDINVDFLRQVSYKYPGDVERLRRMSLVEEGNEQQIRMAYMAIVGSHSVNGVAELHTKLLKEGLFRDFYELWPEKFNNKTNGITQRRWLRKSNPSLSGLISSTIGDGWIKDLSQLKKLEPSIKDASFRKKWQEIKFNNKKRLIEKLQKWDGITLNPEMLFDVQVKRMHEYKRQLLNVLHCVALYQEIKAGKTADLVPRTVIFSGKAAPGYYMAKLIIKFINSVAEVINRDSSVNNLLQIYFLPNYRVSLAEYIFPASDISEQISTAGTEASGTGNMKFALNGALTIGTMDGANVEMLEEVGDDNMFIFGLLTPAVADLKNSGYNPRSFYDRSPTLKGVMDLIQSGFFSPERPDTFKPLVDSVLNGSDTYMVMADFDSYHECQKRVAAAYRDQEQWTKMSILNVARMGKFSSDRTIGQYAREIWNIKPMDIFLDHK